MSLKPSSLQFTGLPFRNQEFAKKLTKIWKKMDKCIKFWHICQKINFCNKKPVLNAKSISVLGKPDSKSRYQYWFRAMIITHLRLFTLGQDLASLNKRPNLRFSTGCSLIEWNSLHRKNCENFHNLRPTEKIIEFL